MSLGSILRRTREERALTLREAADQLGMTFSYMQRIESGERFPSADYIEGLAAFLNVTPRHVFDLVKEDRGLFQLTRLGTPSLTSEAIETRAGRDRLAFLQHVGRDHLRFPRDRNEIPKVLCQLNVVYDEVLFGAGTRLVYAGLFPPGHTYQTETSVIVVATRKTKNRGDDETVSERTKNFHVLHEVGHYRLHWVGKSQSPSPPSRLADRPIYCSSGDRSPLEYQANLYASSFLMPRSEILRVLDGERSVNLRKRAFVICEQFSVEEWMLRFRLARLGIRVI